MNKEELCIGNIVIFEDSEYIIKSIKSEYLFLSRNKPDAGLEVARLCDIFGKKIDESFLINLGFYQDKNKFFKNYNGNYIMYNMENYTLSVDCLGIKLKRVFIPDLKYVHEFQNLFTILKIKFKD